MRSDDPGRRRRGPVAALGGLALLVGAALMLTGEPQWAAAGPGQTPLSATGLHGVASAEAACVAAAGGAVTGSTAYLDGMAIVLGTETTGQRWVCDAVVAGSGWTVSTHPAH